MMHRHGGNYRYESLWPPSGDTGNAGRDAGSGHSLGDTTPPSRFIRRRRRWSRYSHFFSPFALEYPPIDNSLPERIDRIVTAFSRLSGIILLMIALAASGWWLLTSLG